MMKKIIIDEVKCIHCGQCIRECVVNCIQLNEKRVPGYISNGNQMCVGCQHCLAVCPTGAFSFEDVKPEGSEAVTFGNSEALLGLMKSRRSVRFFKKQDVPEETLVKLVNMLAYPPKGGNADSLHFSLVRTSEKMGEIKKVTYDTIQGIKNGSPIIEFCRDNFNKGTDFIYRSAPAMIGVSVNKRKAVTGCENADPIIALSYLELYAQSLGLGTLWSDCTVSVMHELPNVRSLLEIPEDYELNYTMLIGIPAVRYQRTVQREPAHVTLL